MSHFPYIRIKCLNGYMLEKLKVFYSIERSIEIQKFWISSRSGSALCSIRIQIPIVLHTRYPISQSTSTFRRSPFRSERYNIALVQIFLVLYLTGCNHFSFNRFLRNFSISAFFEISKIFSRYEKLVSDCDCSATNCFILYW